LPGTGADRCRHRRRRPANRQTHGVGPARDETPPGRRTSAHAHVPSLDGRIKRPGRVARVVVVASASVAAGGSEAVVAVNRLAVGRLERNLCRLATPAARGREHLPRAPVQPSTEPEAAAATRAPLGSSGLAGAATRRAPLWICEAALGVEVLLAGSEHELLPAICANQNLVRIHGTQELLSAAAPSVSSRLRVRGPVVQLLGLARGRPAGIAAGLYVRLFDVHRTSYGRNVAGTHRHVSAMDMHQSHPMWGFRADSTLGPRHAGTRAKLDQPRSAS
jgi:hypothetical protein